jgi:hypothetical protein
MATTPHAACCPSHPQTRPRPAAAAARMTGIGSRSNSVHFGRSGASPTTARTSPFASLTTVERSSDYAPHLREGVRSRGDGASPIATAHALVIAAGRDRIALSAILDPGPQNFVGAAVEPSRRQPQHPVKNPLQLEDSTHPAVLKQKSEISIANPYHYYGQLVNRIGRGPRTRPCRSMPFEPAPAQSGWSSQRRVAAWSNVASFFAKQNRMRCCSGG